MKDIDMQTLVYVVIGVSIFSIAYTYFPESMMFTILTIVSILFALVIPLLLRYQHYTQMKTIEREFPYFLRDITDNIKTGMTLTQAIKASANKDYGLLTRYVKKLSAQVSWGIDFKKALRIFADEVGSKVIKRTVKTIIEAYEVGGKIDTILDAIATSVEEIERIKKERSTRIYAQMINGYFIFFIYIAVMVILTLLLIPALESEIGGATGLHSVFKTMFRDLVILQGIFAGLAIGKMAEGTIVAGIKHSFVMVAISLIIFGMFA